MVWPIVWALIAAGSDLLRTEVLDRHKDPMIVVTICMAAAMAMLVVASRLAPSTEATSERAAANRPPALHRLLAASASRGWALALTLVSFLLLGAVWFVTQPSTVVLLTFAAAMTAFAAFWCELGAAWHFGVPLGPSRKRCDACGYALEAGPVDGVCPECGASGRTG